MIKNDSIVRMVSRVEYLKEIFVRYESEYFKILKIVNHYNLMHKRGMGFWSLARIIFPVVETISYVIGKKKERFLLEDLHVPFGHLVWQLYRNALMHSDEPRFGIYKGKAIYWSLHLGNEGIGKHIIVKQSKDSPTTIHIDLPRLYSDLNIFLIREIEKNDNSMIAIQVGVIFPENQNELFDELEKIYIEY